MTLPMIPPGFPLLAQATAAAIDHGVTVTAGVDSARFAIVPLMLVIMIPSAVVILTAIIFGIRHARFEREVEHAERMKALETGRTLPQDAPFWTPNKLCLALGVVLPGALFMLALAASNADDDLMPFVWPVAGALGGVGIICGTLVALILPRQEAQAGNHSASAKPSSTDPDAFDVASSRAWSEAGGPHRN